MVRQAPLGHDRSAARHDAGHAPGGHRHVAQQHAGMDGEVVDTLLGLLDERVAIDLPGEIFGPAADLLERLVNRHGADRHRRVAQDPLAGLVDLLPGRQVHHRVGAPQRRPAQLLDFFLDRRRHRRVADVGVDLHQEVAADDHRLELEVVDVGRDDRAAARDLVADEGRRQALAAGDERHLGRDLALAGIVELRRRSVAAARRHPRLAQLRQAGLQVGGPWTAGVVEAHRRFAVGEPHLAQRHADRERTLGGRRRRLVEHAEAVGERLGVVAGRGRGVALISASLRPYERDQVPRVRSQSP